MALWLTLAGLVAGILTDVAHPLLFTLVGGVLLIPRRVAAFTAGGAFLIGLGLGSLSAAVRAPEVTAASMLASEVARCEVSGSLLEHLGNNASLVGISRATCTDRAPLDDLGALAFPRIDADAGTAIDAAGWIYPLEREGFDSYLTRSGAIAGFHPIEVATGSIPSGALAVAAEMKGGLRNAMDSLGVREGALLLGLTIGDTSRMDPVTEDHLRRAGLTHLVAVSGHTVAYTDGFVSQLYRCLYRWVSDTPVLGAQVGIPGGAPTRRERARPGVSRGELVIVGGFEVVRSPWSR